jgi:hypothetical protein
MTTPALLVVQTYYCTGSRGAWFEIHLAAHDVPHIYRRRGPLCPCVVLVTSEATLYQDALDLEGTPARVRATWHRENPYSVLDNLEVAA